MKRSHSIELDHWLIEQEYRGRERMDSILLVAYIRSRQSMQVILDSSSRLGVILTRSKTMSQVQMILIERHSTVQLRCSRSIS